jgi:LL-diaminopimelate aminotransferase
MQIRLAHRLSTVPPDLVAHLNKLKAEARARGADLIDLSVGDPDLPTPRHIVEAAQRAAAEAKHHQYPSYVGMDAMRSTVADFYRQRFGVKLDPAKETIALIGSKEGIAHFTVAAVDPGDVVLCPDPAYPVYATWARFAGAEVYAMPLRRDRGFLPDLEAIPADVRKRAKLMWVNYPNNPTAALATRDFYARVAAFAREHGILVASDLAYSELYYDCEPPPSFLEAPGAMECGIEFHSLSKTYNMTGWRVGFACGNAELISGLAQVKTNTDSGTFEAIQVAAIAALSGDQSCVRELRETYRRRMALLCDGLAAAGYEVIRPKASFYCLIAVPPGTTSIDFAAKLLAEAQVVGTPATGFGQHGEGYFRLTVCAPEARLSEAVRRLARLRE